MTEVIFAVMVIAGLTIVLVVLLTRPVAAVFSEEVLRGTETTPEQVAEIGAGLCDTGEINCP
ncbi:hypothetical protein EOL96_06720 [Candidatus Saccharibacteria bacterium]|nr:hypothetical protein [Candidatus Saccharibacteria bacterium]